MSKMEISELIDKLPLYATFIHLNDFDLKMINLGDKFMPGYNLILLSALLNACYWVLLFFNFSITFSFVPIILMLVLLVTIFFHLVVVPYMKRNKIPELKWYLFKRKLNKIELLFDFSSSNIEKWINIMAWFDENVNKNHHSIYICFDAINDPKIISHNYIFKNQNDAVSFKLLFGSN